VNSVCPYLPPEKLPSSQDAGLATYKICPPSDLAQIAFDTWTKLFSCHCTVCHLTFQMSSTRLTSPATSYNTWWPGLPGLLKFISSSLTDFDRFAATGLDSGSGKYVQLQSCLTERGGKVLQDCW